MATPPRVPTYGMQQRSDHPDFYIRDQSGGYPTATPHRHEYFQIQINLGGDTVQHIGGAVRPFARKTLAFILPHRLHVIPHPANNKLILINFTQDFFLPHVKCDRMDLEDISIGDVPELAPFRFQEHIDFTLSDEAFTEVQGIIQRMRAFDQTRELGSAVVLKGFLLQLIGRICNLYHTQLVVLSANQAEKRGRRDALARVSKYVREQIGNPGLTLKEAASAAFLSPNYLTHLLRQGNRQFVFRPGPGAAHETGTNPLD